MYLWCFLLFYYIYICKKDKLKLLYLKLVFIVSILKKYIYIGDCLRKIWYFYIKMKLRWSGVF